MIGASFDLGSNAVKYLVASGEPGKLEVLDSGAEITRIGEGLDQTGRLKPEAQARTLRALIAQTTRARALGATRFAAVGTAGLRGAANSAAFLAEVQEATGLTVEVIDGLREAELTFRGPAAQFGPGPVLAMDVGGRSTEFVYGTRAQIEQRISLELGGVRLTERFFSHDPPSSAELEACRAFIRSEFDAARFAIPAEVPLVGVSGTVLALLGLALNETRMAAVIAEAPRRRLSRTALETIYARLSQQTTAERIFGDVVPPGRADVIVAGTLLVLGALETYQRSELAVTDRGVRFGLLEELLRPDA